MGGVARRGDAEDDLDVCPPKLFFKRSNYFVKDLIFVIQYTHTSRLHFSFFGFHLLDEWYNCTKRDIMVFFELVRVGLYATS